MLSFNSIPAHPYIKELILQSSSGKWTTLLLSMGVLTSNILDIISAI